VFCLLLAAATAALYFPVSGHAFLTFDDHDYVTANPHIHAGLSWTTLKWAFTSTTAANWHPLTWLSHALDFQLFGLNPAGHHLDSVLIHAANAVLLFLLLQWATKRAGPSLLVAALFAVHPLNVESVAWVAERKNVLSTLFFFLAIGAYGWYAQRPNWRRYLLLAAMFAAGLMAKPMVVTLPCVLLLLDYWPLGRIQTGPPGATGMPRFAISKLILEKVPLFFLSALSAVITIKAQRSGQAVRTLHQFSAAVRIENAVVAYASYLWKMLWPARLAPLYPHPGATLPAWQLILSAVVLIGITLLVVVQRSRRYLLVGWLWFLGTLIPVIGLVQIGDAAMADRYAYIPLIGIFVMMAWGLDDWRRRNRSLLSGE
jgi:protein O-mannosyl-transferase